VVVRDCRRRGEVAPAEFYCSLEENVPGRTAPAIFRFPLRGEIPREHNCLVFAPAVFEIRRAPQETGFFCSRGILFTQSTTWVFCSAGKSSPRGNPLLTCTRTDDILKKFEFKMNFKLKINVKQDHANFRSIQ
jgi:hypothetical protein